MAYGLAVAAAGTPADPDRDTITIATAGVALAVLLVPGGLAAAAFVSRPPDAPIAVLTGMALAVGIGLPLLWFRNPLAALIAGYAAGAVVAVARPEHTGWHKRAVGAGIVALITLGGMAIAFVPTAVIAPALPFMAMGIADLFEPRAR